MARVMGLSEILENAMRMDTDIRKVDYLKSQRDNYPLMFLLKVGYDDNVQWDLPAGTPSYKREIYPNGEMRAYMRVDDFRSFQRGWQCKWRPEQKDMAFTQMLEQIDARDDAILLIDQSGPTTALVKLKCQIPPRYFTDYLNLLKAGGRWQIVQKVFAMVVRP